MLSLQEHWTSTCRTFCTNDALISQWWTFISDHYTEPHRHYHTLSHLEDMFTLMHQHSSSIHNATAFSLATFFHDVIYETKERAALSEQLSADAWDLFAQEAAMDSSTMQLVHGYIMATKTHEATNTDPDLLLFLDIDLAVLARDDPGYDLYTQQIRQEYIQYNDEQYCKGRCAVMRKLLAQERLFKTDLFHARYNEKARSNVTRELAALEADLASKTVSC
eukprot:TRINITY_DN11472_c0_g1_i1.p2 TRINITY_DN11472_c0_g1~~TRINITY_DN11472_c0_g1_i1.p2  ORF type:complete len:221 (-),score=52.93 TRINITY_DN11472_c0_g1_i1:137-799(-)